MPIRDDNGRLLPIPSTGDGGITFPLAPKIGNVSSDIYVGVAGRKFRAWIDADSRSNGYNAGDLITNPAYIIESIIRDELLAEKELTITTKTSTTILRSTSLLSSVDDYYNGSYYHNLTTGFETTISDYTGSTKEFTLASADTSVAVNDIFELTSIKYSDKIDYASFDTVGNTTNGKRDDWLMARSLNAIEDVDDILSRLCFESHCILFENNTGKYKLVALDTDTTTGYFIDETQIIGSPSVSRTRNVFNKYSIEYFYNYATSVYERSVSVDAQQSTLTVNTFTPSSFEPNEDAGVVLYGGTIGTSLCGASQTRYKKIDLFDEKLIWHYDDATVNLWVKKIIEWNYAPKIIVTLTGWNINYYTSARIPLISYELGDQCTLSHPLLDPDVSDYYYFMVVGKSISPSNNEVTLTLMQMR